MSNSCSRKPKNVRRKKPLIIRYMRKTDRRCAAHIDKGCFSNSASEFKSTENERIIVATQAGEIVGYIRFDINDDHIYLSNVCVAETARGENICKKMTRWLIGKLPTYKRERIELYAANEVAEKCYASVGFYQDDGGGSMIYRVRKSGGRSKTDQ
jgi:ribosomal protein S18 acetylase RimI-like enzyme